MPSRLAQIIGKAEWKTTLKTPDRKKAARMAHMLTLQYDAEIELAEQKLARQHPSESLHLSDEQVTNLSLLHFRGLAGCRTLAIIGNKAGTEAGFSFI